MHRIAIQLTILVLLGVGLGGPIFQNVDPWDSFPDTGDNAVLIVTMAALWIGLTLCLALLIPLLFGRGHALFGVLVLQGWHDKRRVPLLPPGRFDLPLPLRV